MKILVLGAGAVGGYASPHGNAQLKVSCVTQDAVKPAYDIVMFTAKAYDLASALEAYVARRAREAASGKN